MENCIRRFPVVSAIILNKLDHQTLVRSKEISRRVSEFINNERFYWIRVTKKCNVDWRKVIKKVPIKNLKELAIDSEISYWIRIIEVCKAKYQGQEKAWNEVFNKIPINFVRQLAIVVRQFCNKSDGWWSIYSIAPLNVAVEYGNLDLCKFIVSKTRNKNIKIGQVHLL